MSAEESPDSPALPSHIKRLIHRCQGIMGNKTYWRGFSIITVSTAVTFVIFNKAVYHLAINIHLAQAKKTMLTNYLNFTSENIDNYNKSSNYKNFNFFSITKMVKTENCASLFRGKKSVISRAVRKSNSTLLTELLPKHYLRMTRNCTFFIHTRDYITDHLSDEERDFPIAFSILMYKDIFQVERLLRAIYRPQNYYCIHIDKKCSLDLKLAVMSISSCFENVFISSVLQSVKWGYFSVVQAELNCLKDLLKFKKWKYFINLTGQEFPLRTNYELVRILKVYNGANDIRGSRKKAELNSDRFEGAGPAPHGLVPVKGSAHIVVNREFVQYLLNNKTALDIIKWTKNTLIPDETLFASLNKNPHLGIKGSYTGNKEEQDSVSRYKNWGSLPCHGKFVRQICIFGTGDLPVLYKAKQLFVNKLYWNYHHYVMDCLEENIFNKTRDQYYGKVSFDDTFYKSLDFVHNHL